MPPSSRSFYCDFDLNKQQRSSFVEYRADFVSSPRCSAVGVSGHHYTPGANEGVNEDVSVYNPTGVKIGDLLDVVETLERQIVQGSQWDSEDFERNWFVWAELEMCHDTEDSVLRTGTTTEVDTGQASNKSSGESVDTLTRTWIYGVGPFSVWQGTTTGPCSSLRGYSLEDSVIGQRHWKAPSVHDC